TFLLQAKDFPTRRTLHRQVKLLDNLRLQCVLGCWFAMYQENLAHAAGDRSQPVQQLPLIGMPAKFVDDLYFCPQSHRFAKDGDLWFLVDDPAAQRMLGLISSDEDQVSGILDTIPEMMQDTASFTHPGRCDYHVGNAQVVQGLAVCRLADVAQTLKAERVFASSQERGRFLVEFFVVLSEYLGDVHRKRAIHENRKARQFTCVDQLVQEQIDLLCSAHRER